MSTTHGAPKQPNNQLTFCMETRDTGGGSTLAANPHLVYTTKSCRQGQCVSGRYIPIVSNGPPADHAGAEVFGSMQGVSRAVSRPPELSGFRIMSSDPLWKRGSAAPKSFAKPQSVLSPSALAKNDPPSLTESDPR